MPAVTPMLALQDVAPVLFGALAGAVCVVLVLWGRQRLGRRRHQPSERSQQDAPGTQLGQYTLEKKIGEGGMGKVFRGRHALLRRPAAIKTLRPEVADDEAIGRFEQEVQLTAQLRHPNTVAVFDYGRTPEGHFYYAMEYLTGASLESIVETTGPLDEGRTIHVLRQLCGSLSEAHGIRLIHRDIKPSNLILCVRGGIYDWLKVVDFGLVRDVGNDPDAELEADDEVAGSPLYMAPEALIPSFRHDGRQDIYAIGAVAYYMLTGTPVFQGGATEILTQHLTAEPEPLSKRAGRTIEPTLEALVLQCLEKRPDARPPTTGALLSALEVCPDVGSWTAQQSQLWWIRHEVELGIPDPLPHAEATSGFFPLCEARGETS